MKKRTILFISILSLILMVSMSYASGEAQTSSPENAKIDASQTMPSISGKVVETMDSGGYSYINVEKNGNQIWVAVPNMKVTVGQEVSLAQGMIMNNFKSKSLNRTFKTIVFSTGPAGQQTMTGSTSGYTQAQAPLKKIKVEKASGPNAYTVAELHDKSAELDKKSITIKGQVIKVSPNIMGKNWIHIQDGSTSASSGSGSIILTSQDLPSVGDIVTGKGIFYKDKDFGSGYKYSVIVEEASITK